MVLISCIFSALFDAVFNSNDVIINLGFKEINIAKDYANVWYYIKIIFSISFILANIVYSNIIYKTIEKIFLNKKVKPDKYLIKSDKLNLLIGNDEKTGKNIYVQETGLYQNFLITGTIGTGKTSSAMYPFTEQIIRNNSKNKERKTGTLTLDNKEQNKNHENKYTE